MRSLPGPAQVLAGTILAVCLLGSGACDRWTGKWSDGAPSPADLEAVGALARSFVDAHNEGDSERLASLFTEDAILVPPDEPTLEGRDAIADYLDDLLKDAPATMEFDVQELKVMDDWAFERIDVTLQETDPETGEEIETWMRILWILQRQPDGAWKIARFIGNFEEPGDEQDPGTETGRQA